MRAWIEVYKWLNHAEKIFVALYMRAWIEVGTTATPLPSRSCRPLHEGVD